MNPTKNQKEIFKNVEKMSLICDNIKTNKEITVFRENGSFDKMCNLCDDIKHLIHLDHQTKDSKNARYMKKKNKMKFQNAEESIVQYISMMNIGLEDTESYSIKKAQLSDYANRIEGVKLSDYFSWNQSKKYYIEEGHKFGGENVFREREQHLRSDDDKLTFYEFNERKKKDRKAEEELPDHIEISPDYF